MSSVAGAGTRGPNTKDESVGSQGEVTEDDSLGGRRSTDMVLQAGYHGKTQVICWWAS